MAAAPPCNKPVAHPDGFHELEVLRVASAQRHTLADKVIAEAPVALVYNGVPFTVMMATPCDLPDFALGFALAEGIITTPGEYELLDILRTPTGITLQGLLPSDRFEALQARRRNLAGRSGCGLCGIEALEDAVRPVSHVESTRTFSGASILAGMRTLVGGQVLNKVTGGAHAAAFISEHQPLIVREDVGRHNALDKLIGALAMPAPQREALLARTAQGFLAITSRASWEMVYKAANAGIAIIAAISAPTSLAIEAAEAAGVTLIAFARDDGMNIYTHAGRIT